MTRFIIIFAAVLIGLFTLEMQESVQTAAIQPFTSMLASISAGIIIPFDDAVVAYGRIIEHRAAQFAVSIEAGCNGVEATIVLIAGVLAFPATWKQKLSAIVLGFIAIQAMNILRIVSLFYLGQWDLAIFTWTHLYIWPVLIMLDVLIVFIVYLRYLNKQQTMAAQPA